MVEEVAENNSFDVVIIGAGPAGGSTAWHAALEGLHVLVLEEHEVVGEPVHCGECLSQVAIDKLPKPLPSEVISMPVKGVRVIFPDGIDNFLNEPGVVLEKHKFEQWLIKEAQQAGAVIKLGHRVNEVKREGEGWIINTPKGSFNSKILVDATGVASSVSAQIGLNQARFKSVIGIQYEMENIPQNGYLDFYLWPEIAPHGYLWMIPKSNGRANVGLVTNQNNKAKEFLTEFVKRMEWTDKKVVKTFGGLIPASGPLENTVGDGVILVGDAAGFTSPLFEGGTHLSIQSGKYAAKVAKKAIDANDNSKKVLSEYESLWKSEFPKYKTLIKGKDAIYSFTDEELKEISKMMPKTLEHISAKTKARIGMQLLTKHKLVKKGVLDMFNAFRYSRADKYGW